MSNTTHIGRQSRGFFSAPQFDGYSKVVIVVSEDVEYSSGTDTGRTLTINNPWGTQVMADDILANIRGYQYQPYKAQHAFLDPAAELGDGIGVNDVYGGIYTMDTIYGGQCCATVSAPSEEELDHEYPYVPKQERKVTRKQHGLSSELKVQAGLISAEVLAREGDTTELKGLLAVERDRIIAEVSAREDAIGALKASIDLQAGQVTAQVSKTGGDTSSFGWELADDHWELFSNGTTVLNVNKDGLTLSGKITALSGKIGGFDIHSDYLSYNNHEWSGTNTLGAYLGIYGLQLGKNFKVDMQGNLTAASGTFSGTVYAGNIQYGEEYGTLSGLALSGGSISADRLIANCITTGYTSAGINASLGYADYANGVFAGWNVAPFVSTKELRTSAIQVNGKQWKPGYIIDGNGNPVQVIRII